MIKFNVIPITFLSCIEIICGPQIYTTLWSWQDLDSHDSAVDFEREIG